MIKSEEKAFRTMSVVEKSQMSKETAKPSPDVKKSGDLKKKKGVDEGKEEVKVSKGKKPIYIPQGDETVVVCIRRKDGKVFQDCDVYIGRACYMGGWQLPASIWGNPFKVTNDCPLEQVLEKYEDYLRNNQKLMECLPSLKGKRLGCWCKKKTGEEPCHGDVILKVARELNLV